MHTRPAPCAPSKVNLIFVGGPDPHVKEDSEVSATFIKKPQNVSVKEDPVKNLV